MSGKFINLKKVIIPIITFVIMASQLSGCAAMPSKDLIHMLDDGQNIAIEVALPTAYEVYTEVGEVREINWIQLDQLKTFNNGFRQSFDKVFNTNIITQDGVNGKSSCLFVDAAGDRNGNTTIEDAFRNKVFQEKYWSKAEVKDKLTELGSDAYTDVGGNAQYGLMGAINAYFNLLQDNKNPDAFNPTKSVTREEFNALVYRSTNPVSKDYLVNYAGSEDTYALQMGGETDFTAMSKQMDKYNFLTSANGSMDATNIGGAITRAEAVYTIVTSQFSKELADVREAGGKVKCGYTDVKNGGNIALKQGFQYKDKTTKQLVGKDRWQTFTLYRVVQNPDKGLQTELHDAMVVASNLGLLGNGAIESRWDEPLSKAEAIQLMIDTFEAKNDLYGYQSTAEYGKVNKDKFKDASLGNANAGDLNKSPYTDVDKQSGVQFGTDANGNPIAGIKLDPNSFTKEQLEVYEQHKKELDKEFEKQLAEIEKQYNQAQSNKGSSSSTAPDVKVQPPKTEKPADGITGGSGGVIDFGPDWAPNNQGGPGKGEGGSGTSDHTKVKWN